MSSEGRFGNFDLDFSCCGVSNCRFGLLLASLTGLNIEGSCALEDPGSSGRLEEEGILARFGECGLEIGGGGCLLIGNCGSSNLSFDGFDLDGDRRLDDFVALGGSEVRC